MLRSCFCEKIYFRVWKWAQRAWCNRWGSGRFKQQGNNGSQWHFSRWGNCSYLYGGPQPYNYEPAMLPREQGQASINVRQNGQSHDTRWNCKERMPNRIFMLLTSNSKLQICKYKRAIPTNCMVSFFSSTVCRFFY